MAFSFPRVVIIGASGSLGSRVLKYLLEEPRISKITIVGRSSSKSTFPSSPRLNVVKVDSYTDESALTTAFKDHDILISVANSPTDQLDNIFLSAAIKAGVRRIMPSEYTLDVTHPRVREVAEGSQLTYKADVAEKLQKEADKGEIEFSTIVCGGFLDWGLGNGFIGIDIPGRKATLFDEGKHISTGVTLDFLARSIVTVVKMPLESTRNKRIRVAEAPYSGREIVDILEETLGEKFDITYTSTADLIADGREGIKAGDPSKVVGLILGLNFEGTGVADLRDGLEWNATGEFALARKDLKQIVREAVGR